MATKPQDEEIESARAAALADLVRLLARQAAAEHHDGRLRGRTHDS